MHCAPSVVWPIPFQVALAFSFGLLRPVVGGRADRAAERASERTDAGLLARSLGHPLSTLVESPNRNDCAPFSTFFIVEEVPRTAQLKNSALDFGSYLAARPSSADSAREPRVAVHGPRAIEIPGGHFSKAGETDEGSDARTDERPTDRMRNSLPAQVASAYPECKHDGPSVFREQPSVTIPIVEEYDEDDDSDNDHHENEDAIERMGLDARS